MGSASRDTLTALVFDYGERRIGVAFANRRTGIATPLTTLTAQDGAPDWQRLDTLVREWRPAVLAIGLAYNTEGSETPMLRRALKFAEILGSRYGLRVDTVDERLSSMEATLVLRDQRREGLRKKRVRPGDIDTMAARLIAESWLNAGESPENQI